MTCHMSGIGVSGRNLKILSRPRGQAAGRANPGSKLPATRRKLANFRSLVIHKAQAVKDCFKQNTKFLSFDDCVTVVAKLSFRKKLDRYRRTRDGRGSGGRGLEMTEDRVVEYWFEAFESTASGQPYLFDKSRMILMRSLSY